MEPTAWDPTVEPGRVYRVRARELDISPSSAENWGRAFQLAISARSARRICGREPPAPGYERIIRDLGGRLFVSNLSGTYVLRSSTTPRENWPSVFGIDPRVPKANVK